MDAQGIAAEAQHIEFVADMRYRGQGYEIPVPWATDLEERFNELHEQLYGFRMPNTASEIVNLRAVGTGDRPQPELPEEEPREAMLEAGHARARRAAPGLHHPRPVDRHRVRLDDRDPRRLRRRDRPLLQPPDPEGVTR